jgi:hypothetical protein
MKKSRWVSKVSQKISTNPEKKIECFLKSIPKKIVITNEPSQICINNLF